MSQLQVSCAASAAGIGLARSAGGGTRNMFAAFYAIVTIGVATVLIRRRLARKRGDVAPAR